MLNRYIAIEKKMELKLNDKEFITNLQKHQANPDPLLIKDLLLDIRSPLEVYGTFYKPGALIKAYEEPNVELQGQPFDYYFKLLRCSCQCDMLEELQELLAANENFNINNFAAADRGSVCKTLLGWSAFHGHLRLVIFLVEEKSANINAVASNYGGTALHEAVNGDSFPTYTGSMGYQHADIARYLIAHDVDLDKVNNYSETALVCANKYIAYAYDKAILSATSFFRKAAGMQATCSATPKLAEKVRPVIDEAVKQKIAKQAAKIIDADIKSVATSNNRLSRMRMG
jgi:hypothetical protein